MSLARSHIGRVVLRHSKPTTVFYTPLYLSRSPALFHRPALGFFYSSYRQFMWARRQRGSSNSSDSTPAATSAPIPKRRRLDSMAFELDEVEKKVASLLLAVARYAEGQDRSIGPVVLRFTGGWVRDKLLGGVSHDIDVAISNMTGYQFGERLQEYLGLPGMPEEHGLPPMGKLHKIEANPEKSKHLETTTTRIYGLDIDLVNLRKETYTDDSRNPQVEFGSAEEDAFRRDATVNALFYNLNTREVEDLTGRGLDDMERRIIRTPLAPLQTFMDDPLRVLRLIRFASRLSFEIEPECFEFMGNEDIKTALARKISRERVGTEVTKMLTGTNPAEALRLIDQAGLYKTIFSPLTVSPPAEPDLGPWQKVYRFCERLLAEGNDDLFDLQRGVARTENDKILLWMAACAVPWADSPSLPSLKSGKQAPPVAHYALLDGIRAPNRVTDFIQDAFKNYKQIRRLKDNVFAATKSSMVNPDLVSRETIGMAIRQCGPTWRNQIGYGMLYEVSRGDLSEGTIVASYRELIKRVESFSLEDVYDMKRLLDGKTLSSALGVKPGPWMKDALEVVVAWQLRNPDFTDSAAIVAAVSGRPTPGTDSEPSASLKDLISALSTHFLTNPIRAMFANGENRPDVTSQGHKRPEPPLPTGKPQGSGAFDFVHVESPGWKLADGKGKAGSSTQFGMLRWVVQRLDSEQVKESWPLLVPPMLSLLEDADVYYKAIGCEIAAHVLNAVSPDFFEKTGLAAIFRMRLMLCLPFLGPQTPKLEAELIIPLAFDALFALASALPPVDRSRPGSAIINDNTRQSILLSLLNTNPVFTGGGYMTHPTVSTAVLRGVKRAVSELGLAVASHVSLTVQVCESLLTDPFVAAAPALLRVGVDLANATIESAWPRVPEWQGSFVRMMCTAWVTASSRLADLDRGSIDDGGKGAKKSTTTMTKPKKGTKPAVGEKAKKGASGEEDKEQARAELEEARAGIVRAIKTLIHVIERVEKKIHGAGGRKPLPPPRRVPGPWSGLRLGRGLGPDLRLAAPPPQPRPVVEDVTAQEADSDGEAGAEADGDGELGIRETIADQLRFLGSESADRGGFVPLLVERVLLD